MAGGTWTDQNKVLPGVYINYSSAPSALATMGERGVVLIPQLLNWGDTSGVITINDPSECFEKLGYDQMDEHMIWLRQLLIGTNRTSGASKVLVYRITGTGAAAASATQSIEETDRPINSLTVTARYPGTRGNDISVVVAPDPNSDEYYSKFYVQTLVGGRVVDTQTLESDSSSVPASELVDNAWVTFEGTGNLFSANMTLSGGVDGEIQEESFTDFFYDAETLSWNVLAFPHPDRFVSSPLKSAVVSLVKRMSNDEGKKVQAVLRNYTSADSECVISVGDQRILDNTGHRFTQEEMVCWVAGCTAGANVNESLTYASHPDAVSVSPVFTQSQQIDALNAGEFVLFEEFGSIKILQDINTFTTFAPTKGKQFRKNRVIRTLFGICNDAYKTFSMYYVGNTNNDAVGRGLLKAELLNLLLRYQGNNALQNVVADDVVVSPGQDSDSVLIEMYIQPTDSIEKIYINITIS